MGAGYDQRAERRIKKTFRSLAEAKAFLVGGAGKGVIRRILDYGDEWMPHAGIMPVEELGARIRELQDAARQAGRDADIPAPSKAPNPTPAR